MVSAPARNAANTAWPSAMRCNWSGPANRFAALDNAFNGVCRDWRRNGPALAFAGFAFDTRTTSPCPMPCSPFPACCSKAAMASVR